MAALSPSTIMSAENRSTQRPGNGTRSRIQDMKNYPQLAAMGVTSTQHIDKYAVNSIGYTDVLRIVYTRPKGSFLAMSRTYRFPRVQRESKAADGTTQVVMESNPALRAALDELQDILEEKTSTQDVASAILEELRLLEEDIALRNECIRMLVAKIKSD
jgi:hypothetical protein